MRKAFIVVAVLLMASTASAGWYMGLGIAGTYGVEYDFCDYCYDRDTIEPGDADGVVDNATMTFGYELEAMDIELMLGYGSSTVTYTYDEDEGPYRAGWDEKYSRYMVGLGAFYHLIGTDDYNVDAGLRFALTSNKYEEEEVEDRADSDEATLSGWAVGPVLRGRVFLADGKFAIGPEVFINYSSMTYANDWA